VVAVGPIFVCFALFNPTRMLFERWAFTALHYGVDPTVVSPAAKLGAPHELSKTAR
jgi:type IV secretory pathway VirB6-like protein